jgi:[acyl-carrier-protein] S-malonyltransferase
MKTAWIFPGQGSQAVGMGWDLCAEYPGAEPIFAEASRLSGFPLKDFCLHGPEDLLTRTDVLQPAMTAVSIACIDLLREHGHAPDVVAGHSLGEFAALYAAGVVSRTDTLRLVAARGRLMHRASQEAPGAMIAVKDLPAAGAARIAEEVGRVHAFGVANFNGPTESVLSGTLRGVEAAIVGVGALGGRAIPLNVSGAWHSRLMEPIVAEFTSLVRKVTFKAPRIALFMNVTGRREVDPMHIRALVSRQLVSPVLWCPIIERLAEEGVREWLEVGSGKVLRGLLRRILGETGYDAHGISTPRNVRHLAPPVAPMTMAK